VGSYADFGWYLTLKSVSDPCQSTNRKRTFEIDSFRTISCGIGKELSFWQRRTGGFKCFSDYARDTIIDGNFGYKWTITCVLVVRNMQKGTTIRTVITMNVVKTVVKIRGHTPRPPRLRWIPDGGLRGGVRVGRPFGARWRSPVREMMATPLVGYRLGAQHAGVGWAVKRHTLF